MQLFLPNQLCMNKIWICGYIPYKRPNPANYYLKGTNRNSTLSVLRVFIMTVVWFQNGEHILNNIKYDNKQMPFEHWIVLKVYPVKTEIKLYCKRSYIAK